MSARAMNEMPPQRPDLNAFDVALMHGDGARPCDLHTWIPSGHCLSRARLRHLRESEWVVVAGASGPVGLAAYERADGVVRVVREFLVDRRLAGADAARVADVLLAALEMIAHQDGVNCLTFLLRYEVVLAPFEQRGYTSLALDHNGVWLQRKLGWPGWHEVRSDRRH
jgi:hypothetical protein